MSCSQCAHKIFKAIVDVATRLSVENRHIHYPDYVNLRALKIWAPGYKATLGWAFLATQLWREKTLLSQLRIPCLYSCVKNIERPYLQSKRVGFYHSRCSSWIWCEVNCGMFRSCSCWATSTRHKLAHSLYILLPPSLLLQGQTLEPPPHVHWLHSFFLTEYYYI